MKSRQKKPRQHEIKPVNEDGKPNRVIHICCCKCLQPKMKYHLRMTMVEVDLVTSSIGNVTDTEPVT